MQAEIIQIATLMFMLVAEESNILVADLLSDGLENLTEETESGIKDACISYSKLPHPDNYNISRSFLKRMIFLTLWVKYKNRTGESIEFPTGIAKFQLLDQLKQVSIRNYFREL